MSVSEIPRVRSGAASSQNASPEAVSLDGALARTQRIADLLVGPTANDKCKNFPLLRRHCCDTRADGVLLALHAARHFMMRNGPFNRLKKSVRWNGIGPKIFRTAFTVFTVV